MRVHKLYLAALPLMALLATGCTQEEMPTAPTDAAYQIDGEKNLAGDDADALAAIDALIEDVNALEVAAALNRGQSRALRNHLENAGRHIRAERLSPAHAQLRAFEAQVSNFVADNVLTAAQALPLLEGIQRLLNVPLVECIAAADVEQLLWESQKDEEARPWLRVDVMVGEPMYVNEPVVAFARLTDMGSPILDASVQADMRTPDGDCLAVQLLDDGWGIDETAADGTYSAILPSPKVSGTYRFLVTVTGVDEAGTPFSRTRVFVRFATIRPDPGAI